jgi:hypothetical protein
MANVQDIKINHVPLDLISMDKMSTISRNAYLLR